MYGYTSAEEIRESREREMKRLREENAALRRVRDDLMDAIREALSIMDGLGRDTLRAALDAAKAGGA